MREIYRYRWRWYIRPLPASTRRETVSDTQNEKKGMPTIQEGLKKRGASYNIIPLLAALSAAYAITAILSRKRVINVFIHRKIWNIVLLLSFSVSGILGIIMAIRIGSGIDMPFYSSIVYWHTETGILLAISGMFHVAWHWRYYIPRRA